MPIHQATPSAQYYPRPRLSNGREILAAFFEFARVSANTNQYYSIMHHHTTVLLYVITEDVHQYYVNSCCGGIERNLAARMLGEGVMFAPKCLSSNASCWLFWWAIRLGPLSQVLVKQRPSAIKQGFSFVM